MKHRFAFLLLTLCLLSPLYAEEGAEGLCMDIPETLYSYEVLSGQSRVLLKLRPFDKDGEKRKKKGSFRVVDLSTGKTCWEKDIDFSTDSVKALKQGILYVGYAFSSYQQCTCLFDAETGNQRYTIAATPVYIAAETDIMLAYDTKDNSKLTAYRISTGRKLWETDYGYQRDRLWEGSMLLDKNLLLTFASDTRLINLLTGGFTSYKLNRRAQGTSLFTAATTAHFCSNVMDDGRLLWLSDNKRLVCLDRDLKRIWQHNYDKNPPSTSLLYNSGDTLYVLNGGFIYSKEGKKGEGRAFYAAYNPQNGHQLFCDLLPEAWNKKEWGEVLQFATEPLYTNHRNPQQMTLLWGGGHAWPLVDAKGNVVLADAMLTPMATFTRNQVYHKVASYRHYAIMASLDGTECCIVDNTSMIVGRLDAPQTWVLAGDYIVKKNNNQLIFIPFQTVLGKKNVKS